MTCKYFASGVCALGMVAFGAASLRAQEISHRETFEVRTAAPGQTGGVPGGQTHAFIAAEMIGPGDKVVKGAPYSAQTVTEFSQTLADGTRIQRSSTGALYRDGEGRTRREQTLGGIEGMVPAGDLPKLIFISDPVAGVDYVVNVSEKTAQKIVTSGTMTHAAGVPGGAVVSHSFSTGVPGAGAAEMGKAAIMARQAAVDGAFYKTFKHAEGDAKTEQLGTQEIGGVAAEGTRTTFTIPAGQIGNDRPISVVSERWYSSQLQTVVMTRHSDPRTGESVYRLNNVSLAEPDPTLFQVPQGFAVRDGGKLMMMKTPVSK